ncbi:MAG: ATP-binding protein [Bacillota bacterium]|nr:ATP-binding protein [Bacillota bacterium]
MKKKLMFFVLSTVIFCIVIIVSLYVIISNYEYTQNIKEELMLNNNMIISIMKDSNLNLSVGELPFTTDLKKYDYRLTIIDRDGKVIYDSMTSSETMENHNTRPEVIEAREKGEGSSIRFSNTVKKNMIYVAAKFDDNYVIRSSKSIEFVSVIYTKYFQYYLIIVVIVLAMAVLISSRMSQVIVKPIKDLQNVTTRIARGEIDKRVNISTRDEIGQLGKTFNYMADRLQETLKDSIEKQNRLEAILKSMDSGVIAVDRNNRIMMINPSAKKIFGIEKDIIGKSFIEQIRDFELESLLHSEEGAYNEIKIFWPTEKVLRIKVADIVNESQLIGTVAVVHDITDIRRLENIRSEFVANVSHELKTPLTSIMGFAETLRDVDDEENKQKFLDIINNEAERLTRLINDILTLSDLETHRKEVSEVIDINNSISEVYNLMKNTAQAKSIKLVLEPGEAQNLHGSSDKFKQMLINLVDNAIKYSEKGDSVEIGSRTEEGQCVIWVQDTGTGIPKEHIPRLFERFYRVDKARSRARGGTGLGLAIVKHIVLTFHGTIEVESEVGKGSKFIVKLPYNKE